MLQLSRMYSSTFRPVPSVWLAFLVIIPSTIALAGTLREEAVGYRSQGYEAQQRGDAAGALTWYQKAAALDPSYGTPHNDVGILLEGQGRMPDAEKEYLKALELNPNAIETHANLAMLYERMGAKEQAIGHWIKRYELGDPYDPWTNRAEERLLALGVLKTHPGLKGRLFKRRRVVDQEFQAQAKSREEFHAVTEGNGDWP